MSPDKRPLLDRLFKRSRRRTAAGAGFITLLLLSSGTSRTRSLKMKTSTARFFGALGMVTFLVTSFVLVDYIRIKGNSKEFYRLKAENASQKIELQNFSARIRDLETRMARLDLFDRKLRIIANIESPRSADSGDGIKGMGGSTSTEVSDYMLTPGAKVEELVDQMRSDLGQLARKAELQEARFTELQEQLLKKSSLLASTPSIWPVRGWVTSTYGKRVSPFTGLVQRHTGIDIANRLGVPVVATARGVVVRVARDANLGIYIVIRHGYGIKTLYGHLADIYVKVGQRVKRGQKIASLGNTGRSTGSHIHYAVSVNGVFVNPRRYILN